MVSGGAIANSVNLGTVGTDWRIAGSGDLNGDGFEDIVWENTTTGSRAIWLLDAGARVITSVTIGTLATS